jgi:hypothetical protein
MPNQYQTITPAKAREIAALFAKGLSSREVSRRLKIDSVTCLRHKNGPAKVEAKTPEQMEDAIRAALKRGPVTANDLAAALDVPVATVRRSVAALQGRGAMILELPGGAYEIGSTAVLEAGRHTLRGDAKGEWTHHFGLTSDNHLCNRQSRLDVLNAAYDHFERQGIGTVLNAGNYIDGEARFNKTELVTAPGLDNQLDYFIDKFPQRRGIKTLYIDGDDHEGWYAQREGILPGQYLQMKAERAGRHDLEYLGYSEADIALQCGAGEAVMRVLHPGGGSAYATSYTAQKIVESYQGGEKPQVLIIGHYHKAEYGYPREVHCVQAGCTEDQSLFMRKKKIAAHVGFWEVKIKQNAQGVITRFATEWFPFFDRGFYERRFR